MKVLGIFVCLVMLAAACATTPITHRRQMNFIPDQQMNRIGEDAFQEILSKSRPSRNTELTDRVKRIGRRIADASGKRFDWQFVLLDEPNTVNAFCLPGGKVAVYTGILPVAKNDAGLAAVMGHEVAHAILRHGSERMSQAFAAQAGIALAQLSFKESRFKQIIAGALGLGVQYGVMLPFSRAHETEADLVGLQYMAGAGFDPEEAVALWRRMGSLSEKRAPEILSSHPDPERRARELAAYLPKVKAIYASSQHQPNLAL